jgi:hypothetical protein
VPTYARDTSVPADRSRAEIEQTLSRYGATAFMYGWHATQAVIGFEIGGRRYRVTLPLPDQGAAEFVYTPARGKRRSNDAAMVAWEQATRQRWRALALWVKAVLEAAEAGIVTLQEALVPFTVLPDGRTVGEWLLPALEQVRAGEMPAMLPGLLGAGNHER